MNFCVCMKTLYNTGNLVVVDRMIHARTQPFTARGFWKFFLFAQVLIFQACFHSEGRIAIIVKPKDRAYNQGPAPACDNSKNSSKGCNNEKIYYYERECHVRILQTPACELDNFDLERLSKKLPGRLVYSNLLKMDSSNKEYSALSVVEGDAVVIFKSQIYWLYENASTREEFETLKGTIISKFPEANQKTFEADAYNALRGQLKWRLRELNFGEYTVKKSDKYEQIMTRIKAEKFAMEVDYPNSKFYRISNVFAILTLTAWPYHSVTANSGGKVSFLYDSNDEQLKGSVDIIEKRTGAGSIIVLPAYISSLLHDNVFNSHADYDTEIEKAGF